jgi:excisionase family DNA binding protein
MSQEANQKLMSKTEAAEFLSISVRSLHDLISRGALASVRIGGRVLIRPEDLSAFIAARLVVAKA